MEQREELEQMQQQVVDVTAMSSQAAAEIRTTEAAGLMVTEQLEAANKQLDETTTNHQTELRSLQQQVSAVTEVKVVAEQTADAVEIKLKAAELKAETAAKGLETANNQLVEVEANHKIALEELQLEVSSVVEAKSKVLFSVLTSCSIFFFLVWG